MKKINCYANDESLTIVNAINEDFDMYRRLLLIVVMKVDEREKDENFIADNATKEKVNKIIAVNDETNETVKKK